jgi:hypothetical protein
VRRPGTPTTAAGRYALRRGIEIPEFLSRAEAAGDSAERSAGDTEGRGDPMEN